MAHPRSRSRGAWLIATALAIAMPAVSLATAADWHFSVLLDGRAIGTHRFELTAAIDGSRSLLSDARYDVKFLGFSAYRYRHQAQELWNGDCLRSLTATTDDDGDITRVSGAATDNGFRVDANTGSKPASIETPGCTMSFAYWNPVQLARQRQLLDQGTGHIRPVTITALPAGTIPVRGKPTTVSGLRISGLKHPIDVWYADGHWVGLDTSVDGGRKLAYRLH